MTIPPQVVPRRRKLVLSLRLLLALVAVFALWAARVVNQARHQARLVAAIEQAGGSVQYDIDYVFDTNLGPIGSGGPAWRVAARRWLSDRLGVDYVHNVTSVFFGGPGLSSATVRGVTDLDLALVGQLETLMEANFWDAAAITDAGLAHLGGLKRLETLSIDGSRITDAGLIHLSGLKRLEKLDLWNGSIRGPGLVALERLPELHFLGLDGNPITDIGLEYAEGLSQLRLLSLARCPVGDPSLTALGKLPQLMSVNLTTTRVSSEGATIFRQARPDLVVDHADPQFSALDTMTPPPAVLPPPRRAAPVR